MELKCSLQLSARLLVLSFNRTFMELKWMPDHCAIIAFSCFNRTFMELKFEWSGEGKNIEKF